VSIALNRLRYFVLAAISNVLLISGLCSPNVRQRRLTVEERGVAGPLEASGVSLQLQSPVSPGREQ